MFKTSTKKKYEYLKYNNGSKIKIIDMVKFIFMFEKRYADKTKYIIIVVNNGFQYE